MKIDIKVVIIGVLVALLAFTGYKWNDANRQISQLELKNQTLDSVSNKLGQTVLIQEAIVTSNRYAIKQLTDSIFALTKAQDRKIRDVISFYEGHTNTVIKEVQIPYVDKFALKQFSDSVAKKCAEVIAYYDAHTISVPRTAKDSTQNYKVALTVTKQAVVVDSIVIPNKQDIRFVTTKGGLLKRNTEGKLKLWLKPTIQVQVLNSNPLVHVTGQNSAYFKPPVKARVLEKALLIGASVFIGTKL